MINFNRFIIVDDDPINNLLCSMTVKSINPSAEIIVFTSPEAALDSIKNNKAVFPPTLLYLDINMPTMTGWDFMEYFEELDETIKRQVKVFILSSSIDQRDHEKAQFNKYITGFISKPLTTEAVLNTIVTH